MKYLRAIVSKVSAFFVSLASSWKLMGASKSTGMSLRSNGFELAVLRLVLGNPRERVPELGITTLGLTALTLPLLFGVS